MIILFLVLSVVVFVLFTIKTRKTPMESDSTVFPVWGVKGVYLGISIASFVLVVIFTIVSCVLGTAIATEYTIDAKIAMYQEENDQIEEDIDILVKNYMEHEKETFSNAEKESSITLINLYPELKSDTLVQEQIEVYLENNKQMKQLREQKIEISEKKYILYFGH